MDRKFAIMFAAGLGVMAALVAGILVMQRGARIGLKGPIQKVRIAPLDENSSIVVLDFRLENPSDVQFMVRQVRVFMEDPDGQRYEGKVIAESDAQRLFANLPALGQKFNDTLVTSERISPRSTVDRMVAVRFEAPETRLEGRKRFLMLIDDMSGPVSEFSEK